MSIDNFFIYRYRCTVLHKILVLLAVLVLLVFLSPCPHLITFSSDGRPVLFSNTYESASSILISESTTPKATVLPRAN